MFLSRTLVACTVAIAFLLTASLADAAKPKVKKKKQHHVHGVVVAKEDGTFSVKVHVGKKKKAAGTEEKDEKFKLGEGTKFVKVTGKKKDRTETEATKEDFKVGSKVQVLAEGEKAEKVTILPTKEKKKKKNK